MGLNDTPSGERIHIAFFGRMNAGKSSLLNAVTGQNLAVVSDVPGTTTDPIYKAMELLPLGPIMIIDTPGFDDVGKLGEERVKKAEQVLTKADIVVLVTDASDIDKQSEDNLISKIEEYGIPHILVRNKSDLLSEIPQVTKENEIYVSSLAKEGIDELKNKIAAMTPQEEERRIVGDLLSSGDKVVLVVPVDDAAPKGRIILPQQQTIRDILDSDAVALVCKDGRVRETIESLDKRPRMVITDSQAFATVSQQVDEDIPLTSFSVLMARYKGFLDIALEGVNKIDKLKDGNIVLISEGCTHHRQCGDIGAVKLPAWLKSRTGKDIKFEFTSGTGFATDEEIKKYSLIIHCGACMLRPKVMTYRAKLAKKNGVPFTNYGTAIALMKGTLERAVNALKKE